MSYRSDHDAALARVDALESELETLRRGQPPAPAPPRRSSPLVWAMAAIAMGGIVLGAARLGHRDDAPATTTAIAADVRAELRECAGAEIPLSPSCRALIDGLATDVYTDPDLRAAVGAWGEADRELATSDVAARDVALAHRATALQQIAPLL